jgi:hypothetical protein
MNDIFHEMGLVRREMRDFRTVANNVDRKIAHLIEAARR